MTDKLVTIYMPVFNGEKYIEYALESILKQSFSAFKVIVSDNCSTDNTIDIVHGFLSDERVNIIKRPQNIGMIANGNECLKLIDTKYFMGMCHDDLFCCSNALERGVEVLESMPDIPVVYSDMLFVDNNGVEIARKNTGYVGRVNNDLISKSSIISGRNLFSIPLLIRTSAIKDFVYSDEFYHTSDVDFSIWVGSGKDIFYLPETLFSLRFHATNYTARKFNTLYKEFNGLAKKYGIKLNFFEKVVQMINHRFNNLRRFLFYLYLDKFRCKKSLEE